MAGFSNIVIMGNITRDPELKTVGSGTNVVDVNVAVSTYKKGAGDNNQITTFYRASIFGARAETLAKHFKKGDPILLSGSNLDIRTYEKNDGTTGISPEFVANDFSFVGSKGSAKGSSSSSDDYAPAPESVEFSGDMSETPF